MKFPMGLATPLLGMGFVAGICGQAVAQTATPSVLPPLPAMQPTVDRSGVDRSSGTISNLYYESIDIGNQFSGMKAGYDSGGVINHASYIQIERVTIYGGGFMVMRVAASTLR